jgi:hypothetical protein
MKKEVQTRSETNGMAFFATVREAMTYANETDRSVWKVSFLSNSEEVVRLVRVDDSNSFKFESIF